MRVKDTAPKWGPWLAAAPTEVLASDRLLVVCAFGLLLFPQLVIYLLTVALSEHFQIPVFLLHVETSL